MISLFVGSLNLMLLFDINVDNNFYIFNFATVLHNQFYYKVIMIIYDPHAPTQVNVVLSVIFS